MKLPAAITLVAAVLPMFACAEDALVEGGRSPDGHYEVRLFRTPDYDINKDGSERHSFDFLAGGFGNEDGIGGLQGRPFSPNSQAK